MATEYQMARGVKMKTAPLIVDVDKLVVICILISTAFAVGYIVGVDHVETIRTIEPAKRECVEPAKLRKLIYEYRKEGRPR